MKRFSFFLAISLMAMVLGGCQFAKDPNKKEQVFIKPVDTSVYDLAAGRDNAAFAAALKGLSDGQIELYGPEGRTLLFVAAKSGAIENVEALLARNALPLRPSKKTAETPISIATKNERSPVVALLEEKIRTQEDSVRHLVLNNLFKESLEKFQSFFLTSESLKTQLVNRLIERLRFERFLRDADYPVLKQALDNLAPEDFDSIGALAVAEVMNDKTFADSLYQRFSKQLKSSAPAHTSRWLTTLRGERLLANIDSVVAAEIPIDKTILKEAWEKLVQELSSESFAEFRILLKSAAISSVVLELDNQKIQQIAIKNALARENGSLKEDLLLIRQTISKSSLCAECIVMILTSKKSRPEIGRQLGILFEIFKEIPPNLVATIVSRIGLSDLELLLLELGPERLQTQKGVLATAFDRKASPSELQALYSTLVKFGFSIKTEDAVSTLEIVLTNRWTLNGGASELAAILIRDLNALKGKVPVEVAQKWLEREISFLLLSQEEQPVYLAKELITLADRPFDSIIRKMPLYGHAGTVNVSINIAYLPDLAISDPEIFNSFSRQRLMEDLGSLVKDFRWGLAIPTENEGVVKYPISTLHALMLFTETTVLNGVDVSALLPRRSLGANGLIAAIRKDSEDWIWQKNLLRVMLEAQPNQDRTKGLRAIFSRMTLQLAGVDPSLLAMLKRRIIYSAHISDDAAIAMNLGLLTRAMTVLNPRMRFAMAGGASLENYRKTFSLESVDSLCNERLFSKDIYDWIAAAEGKALADESLLTKMNTYCAKLSGMTKESFQSGSLIFDSKAEREAATKHRLAVIEAKQMSLQIEWLNALREIRTLIGNSSAGTLFFARFPTSILDMTAELPPEPQIDRTQIEEALERDRRNPQRQRQIRDGQH